jgi:hypothetical protein
MLPAGVVAARRDRLAASLQQRHRTAHFRIKGILLRVISGTPTKGTILTV